MKLRIRKKDTVCIITGKDKGKKGEVLRVYPDTGKVLVAKLNMATKHIRPTQTEPGGRQTKECPLHASNVMLVCPKCDQPIRPKLDKLSTGERVRVCRKCGEVIL